MIREYSPAPGGAQQGEHGHQRNLQGGPDHLRLGADERAAVPFRSLRRQAAELDSRDGRVCQIHRPSPPPGDRIGRVLRPVVTRSPAVQP